MIQLDSLLYGYDALQPYIDAQTMEIHYTKHYAGYVANLNSALASYPDLQQKSVEDLLLKLNDLPSDLIKSIRNQGGGEYNHRLFWRMMTPGGTVLGQGLLRQAIERTFGSFEQFVQLFQDAAKSCFGSGWAWLVIDVRTGNLEIMTTQNQDNPISLGKQVILALDVWEHAYYIHYQNRRADYIAAWWHVVNWNYVQDLYGHLIKTL